MKRMIALLLAGAMTASVLGGCAVPAGTASTAPAASEAQKDSADTAGGTLIMATNAEFPPYEFYDGSEIVGIDAEIAKAIAEGILSYKKTVESVKPTPTKSNTAGKP